MPSAEPTPAQSQVDEAIAWLVRLRFDEPNPQRERQFQCWLAEHPHNTLAWQRVSSLGDSLAGLPGALSRRTLENTRRQRLGRRDTLKLLAGLAVGTGAAWTLREPLGLPALMADSRTATGERRDLRGSDGSQLQLNTASAIDLRYSASQRLLNLIRGEVSLASNPNDNRPFHIRTRIAQFSTRDGHLVLRENEAGLLLAVRRGEVQLAGPSAPSRRIGAGEVLQFDATGHAEPVRLAADPWGWTDGVLSVQRMPLGAFLAELSRYRTGILRCAPQVADLQVSGTYQLDDTEQILRLLATTLPVRVSYRTRYWVSVETA
ncbi:FecR domain-containing protein [Pseudomonas sp. S75]|uniref:FecR domain-containing protein n=1 Tax=unclassified Pseudomonas TaxID=196821 RepID=UPI0019044B18|nr:MULTISPECIES: FecR domain-containing protein [unclassified Pseudomonas]MBJ9976730.1 FecR domain-containing protein [Pseudomonas sp. S30]MBK0153732.1 FecR domain-containing protein [Pseudomonas sp. S75]